MPDNLSDYRHFNVSIYTDPVLGISVQCTFWMLSTFTQLQGYALY